MDGVCEQIPKDNFILMLNKSNNSTIPIEEIQDKWMFGLEEQNPFLPTFEFIQYAFPQKKVKKEEEIICKNKELFNVNQSKSIYLSKITQLIETDITPKQYHKQQNRKRANEKWKRKLLQGDSSEDQFGGNTHQQKLARNRQSARDSRKRKKIYIELLENKVEDLSQEINRLQGTITNQNTYISYCAKIPSMIKDFHSNYQNQLYNIQIQPSLQQLRILEDEFGVQSVRRTELCNSFFNTLVDHIIPGDLKKLMESAVKGLDMFNVNNGTKLVEFQQKIKDEVNRLELYFIELFSYLFDMAKNYEKIRAQTYGIEQLKSDVIKEISAKNYAQYLINNSEQVIKEEELESNSQKQLSVK